MDQEAKAQWVEYLRVGVTKGHLVAIKGKLHRAAQAADAAPPDLVAQGISALLTMTLILNR